MHVLALTFVATAILSLSTAGSAQTADPPKLRENARYLDVNNWKFVPNGAERAKEIWHDIYLPAMKEAGVPLPTVLHPDTGEWDMVIIYPLAGGYADLQYTNLSPSDAKWLAMIERKYGGAENAAAIGRELDSLISRKDRYLAHEHLDDGK